MRVTVLYFGVLRDLFGVRDEVVELAEGAAVEDLLRILDGRTSNVRMETRIWQSVAVAVNREYAGPVVVLRDGDEVALLPPVSGGSFAEGERLASLASVVQVSQMVCERDQNAD
jgi:molybdopterin converting factor subunit 1